MNATTSLSWAMDLVRSARAAVEGLSGEFAVGLFQTASARAAETLAQQPTAVLLLPLLAFVWTFYFLSFHVRRPRAVYSVTHLNQLVVDGLPRLHRAYWPTFYATHEIAQAAIGSFVRFNPAIKSDPFFEREVLAMADGEQIALDWLAGPTVNDESPIVFTCHGLAGHTDEINMQYLALGVRGAGFRFAIFNRRGCALDMKLTRDFLYLYGCTNDMREVLAHVKARFPRAPLLGVGVSAGSNLLTKYLGETGSESLLDAGLSVANAFDVGSTSDALAKKWFHSRVMINILKNMLARHEDVFVNLERRIEREHQQAEAEAKAAAKANEQQLPDAADAQEAANGSDGSSRPPLRPKLSLKRVKNTRTVREWDEHFTMRTHTQFPDLEALYAAQSTTPEMIARIAVPLLNLHSRDDPIVPDGLVPPLHSNPNLIAVTTDRGGHLGFTEGLFPFNKATWMEKFAVEYFQRLMQPEVWRLVREARQRSRDLELAQAEAEAAAADAGPIATADSNVSGNSVDTQAPTREPSAAVVGEEAEHAHAHSQSPHFNPHSVFPHSHSPVRSRWSVSATSAALAGVVPLPISQLDDSPLPSPTREDLLPDTPEPRSHNPLPFAVQLQQVLQDLPPVPTASVLPLASDDAGESAMDTTESAGDEQAPRVTVTSMEFCFTDFLAPSITSPRKRKSRSPSPSPVALPMNGVSHTGTSPTSSSSSSSSAATDLGSPKRRKL